MMEVPELSGVYDTRPGRVFEHSHCNAQVATCIYVYMFVLGITVWPFIFSEGHHQLAKSCGHKCSAYSLWFVVMESMGVDDVGRSRT